MNLLSQNKQQMRDAVLVRRDNLPPDERKHKSALICGQLERLVRDLAARENRTIEPTIHLAVYAAMRSEVSLQPFVEAAYEQGWNVCFPCMVREQPHDASQMGFYRVPRERFEHAHEAFLNAPLRCLACAALEHDGYERIAPDNLDVIVVPLVAFDNEGGRLGYGGGNYDRLLPLVRDDALVVGAAFAEQRVEAVPREPHDQPLPHIVSA